MVAKWTLFCWLNMLISKLNCNVKKILFEEKYNKCFPHVFVLLEKF